MNRDEQLREKGETYEDAINNFDEQMTDYLTLLFREKLSPKEGLIASTLLDGTRDVERIGDHARDIVLSVDYQIRKKLKFSDTARAEVQEMYDLCNDVILKTIKITRRKQHSISGSSVSSL